MKNKNTSLQVIGIPFLDTIVTPIDHINGDVIPCNNHAEIGGVSNCQILANELNFSIVYLVNSEKESYFKKILLSRNHKNFLLIANDNIKHIEAVVIVNKKKLTRKSYLSTVTRSCISLNKLNHLNFHKYLFFYLEDLCLSVIEICNENDIVLFDFNNNEMIVKWLDIPNHLAENLYRCDFIFCSFNELDKLKSFILDLRSRFPKNLNLTKKIIVHSSKFVSVIDLNFINFSETDFNISSKILNKFYIKSPKTLIGNGDRFSALFSFYLDNKNNNLISVIKKTQQHMLRTLQ